MLYLVESFLSFQGEGKYTGSPSIFLRFGGCNLTCEGFNVSYKSPKSGEISCGCDSYFAVDRAFSKSWEVIKNKDKLLDIVLLHTKNLSYKPNIVITGGEPLLYFKDKIFYSFIEELLDRNFNVHVETNATIKIDFTKFPLYKNLVYAMSVKLSNSGEKREKRINLEAINEICENAKEAFFKFVVDKSGLLTLKNEIEDITSNVKAEIFCMPMGKNNKELEKNAKAVAQFCVKNGYNYSDRVHIRLYNDKKGV